MNEKRIHITLAVIVDQEPEALRVMEILSRVATGLALELYDPYIALNITKSEYIVVEEEN